MSGLSLEEPYVELQLSIMIVIHPIIILVPQCAYLEPHAALRPCRPDDTGGEDDDEGDCKRYLWFLIRYKVR